MDEEGKDRKLPWQSELTQKVHCSSISQLKLDV